MEIFSTCKMTKWYPSGIRHQSTAVYRVVWYDTMRLCAVWYGNECIFTETAQSNHFSCRFPIRIWCWKFRDRGKLYLGFNKMKLIISIYFKQRKAPITSSMRTFQYRMCPWIPVGSSHDDIRVEIKLHRFDTNISIKGGPTFDHSWTHLRVPHFTCLIIRKFRNETGSLKCGTPSTSLWTELMQFFFEREYFTDEFWKIRVTS